MDLNIGGESTSRMSDGRASQSFYEQHVTSSRLTVNLFSLFLGQVLTGLPKATVSWRAERTVMPTCGPRRRACGSPRWSSSGSTEPPPSSSGRLWRTSLQWAAALASSRSATSSLRTTGETQQHACDCSPVVIEIVCPLSSANVLFALRWERCGGFLS